MFRLKRIISLFSLALNLHPPLQTCSETTHCCGSLIIYFLNLNLGKVHIKNSCEILFPVYNLRSETVPSHRWWSVYTRSKDYGNTPVQQVAVTQKTEQQKWAGTSDACRRGHARLKANTDYKLGTSQSYLKVSENVTKYQKFQFKLITKKNPETTFKTTNRRPSKTAGVACPSVPRVQNPETVLRSRWARAESQTGRDTQTVTLQSQLAFHLSDSHTFSSGRTPDNDTLNSFLSKTAALRPDFLVSI